MTDVLFVEDNLELSNLIQTFLRKSGFSIYACTSGEEALEWLKHEEASVLLLDITLPGMDGFALCQHVRQGNRIPILILSARSTKSDQLMGFELGADDYLEKPIDPDILQAKIKALRKRTYKDDAGHIVTSGALTMDLHAHCVQLHGVALELNGKEFELLKLFLENPKKTLHKEFLFNQIWGLDSDSEEQTLTVHVNMLRSKIEEHPKQPKRIVTVWGIGYRYEEI